MKILSLLLLIFCGSSEAQTTRFNKIAVAGTSILSGDVSGLGSAPVTIFNSSANPLRLNTTSSSGVYERFDNSGVPVGNIGSSKSIFSSGNLSDFGISSADVSGSLLIGAQSTPAISISSASLPTFLTATTFNSTILSTKNGATSAPTVKLTGTPFAGSSTTSKALLLLEDSTHSTGWNSNGTYLGINALSSFTGNLLDLQLDGATHLSVDYTGQLSLLGAINGGDSTHRGSLALIGTSSLAPFIRLDGTNISGGKNWAVYSGFTSSNTFDVVNSTNSVTGLSISSTGVATFLNLLDSGLTASQAVFTDGSKNLVSNAITGTGNVVMSAGPTLTGTLATSSITSSGGITITSGPSTGQLILTPTGDGNLTGVFYKNPSGSSFYNWFAGMSYTTAGRFEISPSTATNGSTPNTPVFAVTQNGAATISNSLNVNGNITGVSGTFSGLTASQAVFTDGSKNLVSNVITGTGNVVMSAGPTLTGTIGAASETLSGTLSVTGAITNLNLTASQAVVTDSSKNLASLAYASANTANALVQRDGSGNFTAGTVTAALTGTASGNTTYTANNHGVVLSGSANVMTVIAPDASTSKVLVSGGSSADPSWSLLTNSNLSGSAGITNANLANSSVTVGTTAISLGASSTTLAGLTNVTSTAFTSSTSNPASAGQVRFATTDTLKWRNNANSNDVSLAKDTSDQLSWGGTSFLSSSGVLLAAGFPALTGDVTTSSGSLTTTVAKIAGTTVSGTTGTTNVMFSASPTTTGTLTAATINASGTITSTGGNVVATNYLLTGTAGSGTGGNLRVYDDGNGGASVFRYLVGLGGSSGDTTFRIRDVANSNTDRITIDSTGLMTVGGASTFSNAAIKMTGITTGTNADTVCLKSDGTLLIQAASCTISSRRFKENIFPLTRHDGLDIIMAFKPVEFNMISDPTRPNPDRANFARTQVGLIAEDVEKVDRRLAIYEADGVTPKSYRQEAVIATLVKAVQELEQQVKTLQKTH